jgi:hypothetical protein
VAFDRCKVEEPPLFDLGGGQAAACWLVEPGRSGVDGPSASAVTAATDPRGTAATEPAP